MGFVFVFHSWRFCHTLCSIYHIFMSIIEDSFHQKRWTFNKQEVLEIFIMWEKTGKS